MKDLKSESINFKADFQLIQNGTTVYKDNIDLKSNSVQDIDSIIYDTIGSDDFMNSDKFCSDKKSKTHFLEHFLSDRANSLGVEDKTFETDNDKDITPLKEKSKSKENDKDLDNDFELE